MLKTYKDSNTMSPAKNSAHSSCPGNSRSDRIVRWKLHYPLIALLLFSAGCGMIDLTSRWRNHPVLIDGKNTEWGNNLSLLDDRETSIGIFNDSSFIYIGVITTNRNLRSQILRRGIVFWFDKEGGKDETFGIHYPVGGGGFRQPQEPGMEEDAQPMTARIEPSSEELEIEGPGKDDHHTMTVAEAGGIEARFHATSEFVVYELKVPLSDNGSHPFAIGTKPGEKIGVGVETSNTPAAEKPAEGFSGAGRGEGGGGGGFGGGGYGGGGRGRRGGGGGGGRGSSGGKLESFKMWAKVQLAASDTASH